MNRKFVSTGLLAGLVAGGGAGFILQQSGLAGAAAPVAVTVDDSTPTDNIPADSTPADSTSDSPPALAERGERLREVLQPLVDDGTLTAAQVESVVSTIEDARPLGGHGPGRGRGPGFLAVSVDTVATALGISVGELREQLFDGTTIAEVATANGVEVQTVIDALVAEATARLTERVANGGLTQDEADERLAHLTERITDIVNNGRPGRGDRPAPPLEVEEAGS